MKATKIRVSINQEGLLPEESSEVAQIQFPSIPKNLLKGLGFEKVDDTTFVGVLPIFVNLGEKEQEIELEFNVDMQEFRKRIVEIIRRPFQSSKLTTKREKKVSKSTKITKEAKESNTIRTPKATEEAKSNNKKQEKTSKTRSKKKGNN